MQTDSSALYNVLATESFFDDQIAAGVSPGPERAVAVVDIGDDVSYVLVASPGCLWSRSSGLGAGR